MLLHAEIQECGETTLPPHYGGGGFPGIVDLSNRLNGEKMASGAEPVEAAILRHFGMDIGRQ